MNIVFQGDSITDCGRGNGLGTGYALLCTAALTAENPGEYTCCNRGIGGNRVTDLLARWKQDCINLEPDYLSILIGINDVWHEVGSKNGVDAALFETVYDMLLPQVKAARPDIKIVLMEPFVLPGPATKENWEYFDTQTELRRQAIRRLAKKYDLPTIPLQEIFDEACKRAPAECWTGDGVHPTPGGHALIAKHWLQQFHKLNGESSIDSTAKKALTFPL